ncbi:16S rRNA (uracil(1498)-N(3))-methyltransferase [Actinomyces sp.]|uniref:16S rRNA (uracil(1498)-N(3))-methyltransferase n=1 Tax=Actinomyces sp. TaxID=29317 RepID=UPI0029115B3D|nr:16S rRNA (uracil(1498)-N(3))-methyltransferase [Actinomyces sp.]MDU6679523.1 16S rRNA (uracil(1498)-N(3))-methyltransferase [Actinomyces sp.]
MTAPVFFVSDLNDARKAERFEFTGPDAKHVMVKRIEKGERLDLVDGRGTRARARLVEASSSLAIVQIDEVTFEPEGSPRITLIQALAKNGRDELAIEMATELGVDRVIAWQAERSIVRWQGKKQEKGLQKWVNVLQAATKQSRRARVPALEFAANAAAAIAQVEGAQLIVMHESATEPITGLTDPGAKEYALVVGPEGGITDAELEQFKQAGANIVLVGDIVMRVSTAVAAGLTSLNIATGRI